MKSKVIVTGGAGFIGSALVWGLNRLGIDKILVVDNLDKEGRKERNLADLKFSDLEEKEKFLEKVLQGKLKGNEIDCIFHLGASTSTLERDIVHLLENNYRYSKKLASFAAGKKIRFIYASSAATYGDGSLGFSDQEELLERLKPLNPYGCSKHWFDLWAKKNGLLNQIVGLKYFNVYGPNEYHKGEMRSFVNKAYDQIIESGEVKLFKSYRPEYADGEQKRDFLYVKDAVEMTLFFYLRRELAGIYNIGTGNPHTFNQLVRAVFKALGKEPKIRYIEMPPELKEQYQYFTSAQIEKIRQAGYSKEFYQFESAVREYVLEYLSKDLSLSSRN
jgi:ADP-L-glycero-D-manno-heptose 6-epimerase